MKKRNVGKHIVDEKKVNKMGGNKNKKGEGGSCISHEFIHIPDKRDAGHFPIFSC